LDGNNFGDMSAEMDGDPYALAIYRAPPPPPKVEFTSPVSITGSLSVTGTVDMVDGSLFVGKHVRNGSNSAWGGTIVLSGSLSEWDGGIWDHGGTRIPGPPDGTSNFATCAAGDVSWHPTNAALLNEYELEIPAGATITGLQLDVVKFADYAIAGNRSTQDYSAFLAKDTGIGSSSALPNGYAGDNKANTTDIWATTSFTASYGGPTDLWGQTWTPEDIGASSFGVIFQAANQRAPSQANVDAVGITVYYGEPATDGVPVGDPLISGMLYITSSNTFGGTADLQVLCVSTGSS